MGRRSSSTPTRDACSRNASRSRAALRPAVRSASTPTPRPHGGVAAARSGDPSQDRLRGARPLQCRDHTRLVLARHTDHAAPSRGCARLALLAVTLAVNPGPRTRRARSEVVAAEVEDRFQDRSDSVTSFWLVPRSTRESPPSRSNAQTRGDRELSLAPGAAHAMGLRRHPGLGVRP